MDNLQYMDLRQEMCNTARNMWARRLTNAAGGNFAVRPEKNRILVTPSMMSEHKHCQLQPQDILLIDYEGNILEGEGKLSRETDMHILLCPALRISAPPSMRIPSIVCPLSLSPSPSPT